MFDLKKEVIILKKKLDKDHRQKIERNFNLEYMNEDYFDNFKMNGLPYYLQTYTYWLQKENRHQLPRYYRKFDRGTIVTVDFGMQLGSEFSGQHFAIVLNKHDTKQNSLLTVVPLSSKQRKGYVNLGVEVLNQIILRMSQMTANAKEKSLALSKKTERIQSEELHEVTYTDVEKRLLVSNGVAQFVDGNNNLKFTLGKNSKEIRENIAKLGQIDNLESYQGINYLVTVSERLLAYIEETYTQLDLIKPMIASVKHLADKADRYNKPTYANIRNVTTISKLRVAKFSQDNVSENISLSDDLMQQVIKQINRYI